MSDQQQQKLSKDKSVHVTDEVINTLTSSIGAVLSLIGCALLIYREQYDGHLTRTIGFGVYGFALINMFVASALHHGVNGSERVNHFLRQLDYFAIFIMIAGTFTPFCIIFLENPMRISMLILVWALAIIGIALKALRPGVSKRVTLSFYIGMGWLAVVLAKPIFESLTWHGILALAMGGFFFTVGGLIYGLEKPNPIPGKFGFHEIWHLFVLAGAGSHFYIMYFCF